MPWNSRCRSSPFRREAGGGELGIIAAANGNATQHVAFPAGIESDTRKLTITLTPSIAGTVFGALDYLTSYPVRLHRADDVELPARRAGGRRAEEAGSEVECRSGELNKQVQAGLERLYNYHHPDGGWGWWQTDDSQAFMTAYVLAGLVQAKAAGYDVKEDMIESGRAWLLKEFAQDAECSNRSARLHGVCAGAERDGLECDGPRFCLEPAFDAYSLWPGTAGTGDAAGGRFARQRSGEAA